MLQMRIFITLLAVTALYLQYKAWFSDVGYVVAERLTIEVTEQRRRTEVLKERNQILTAEVIALKNGPDALERRARSDLGMIKQGETFYLVIDGK
ncbi:MAG: septum formation initiator family protein [Pseudomonadales bacterium]|jgi:cell division protein FtsB